jgi:parvulin-like peptidyl-prolyl isomerase
MMDRCLLLCTLLLALAAAPATGQTADKPAVAARVNGRAISAKDVERLVRESVQEREVTPEAREALAAEAIEQLISRRLILDRLTREGQGPAADEVQRAVKALESRAQQEKLTFAQWLDQNGFTAESLQDEVAWRIGWRRYLADQITDETLEKHFQKQRRHFDGSQVRASHILWKLDPSADSGVVKEALERARQVRVQIVAKRLSFAQAAQMHSAAPSRSEGGDVGFIPRHGVMDEAFARAAFDLEQGGLSQPLVTSFGVHLIQCVDIRPGEKAWSDCREELRLAVSRQLFERLAAEERRTAKIEYVPPSEVK